IAKLLGVEIAVPSFSTLSRRGNGLTLRVQRQANGKAGIQLVVDSTGVKIYDAGDWLEEKHKTQRKGRSWRKLHLGLDLVSGEIVCSDLTTHGVGDSTALPGLLDQIDGPIDLFLADGAYDGDPTCDLLLARFGEGIEIAIPPPKNAMLSSDAAQKPTIRDRQITKIEAYERIAWQKTSGYNQRSRGETLVGHWKAVIGPKLKARSFENQKAEARIGVRVLKRMTELGRPNFERTA
ncbi:MAG: IS5 family transposase, partial [Sulfitobacter sp. SK025]